MRQDECVSSFIECPCTCGLPTLPPGDGAHVSPCRWAGWWCPSRILTQKRALCAGKAEPRSPLAKLAVVKCILGSQRPTLGRIIHSLAQSKAFLAAAASRAGRGAMLELQPVSRGHGALSAWLSIALAFFSARNCVAKVHPEPQLDSREGSATRGPEYPSDRPPTSLASNPTGLRRRKSALFTKRSAVLHLRH